MKAFSLHRLTAILLLLCSLLSLSACGKGSLLYEVELNGHRLQVMGGNRPRSLQVCNADGALLWEESVKVDRSVGNRFGTYGLQLLDLDFDGYSDILLVTAANGDVETNACYLYDSATGTYRYNDPLSQLTTVRPNTDYNTIFSFSHTRTDTPAYKDVPASYVTVDTTTAYVWKNGNLIPYRRVSLTYNSEHQKYILSTSDYSELIYDFLDPDDVWYTPEEYAATDFSLLYYFR